MLIAVPIIQRTDASHFERRTIGLHPEAVARIEPEDNPPDEGTYVRMHVDGGERPLIVPGTVEEWIVKVNQPVIEALLCDPENSDTE